MCAGQMDRGVVGLLLCKEKFARKLSKLRLDKNQIIQTDTTTFVFIWINTAPS